MSSVSVRDSGIRLLLVEDNDPNRRLLEDFLSYHGYEIATVEDGIDFFPVLEQFKPHVVLLDLKLPHVDGFTILKQLLHHSVWQHLPVIVLSAFAFQADRQQALALGARRYFIKPLNLNELISAIHEEAHCFS